MFREAIHELDDDIDEFLSGSDVLPSDDHIDVNLPSQATPAADLHYDGSGGDPVSTRLRAVSDRFAVF